MTLNEIKINALKLMFTNYSYDLTGKDVESLTDEEYTQYTVNMDASINRALGRIQAANVLVDRKERFVEGEGLTDALVSYNVRERDTQFYQVTRVARVSPNAYIARCDFALDGDCVIVQKPKKDEYYIVYYKWSPKRITAITGSFEEVDVPDNIAEIIPYFIKADLYEEEEPKLALNARNIFESLLETYELPQSHTQGCVVNIYEGAL